MRLEFNGLILDATREELSQGFTLSVGSQVISLTPGTPASVPEQAQDAEPRIYRLRFHSVPSSGKIPAIKTVREFLYLGLGEAKAVVEGRDWFITGPAWEKSKFRDALMAVAAGCFTASPSQWPTNGDPPTAFR